MTTHTVNPSRCGERRTAAHLAASGGPGLDPVFVVFGFSGKKD